MDINKLAQINLEALKNNPYPGRIIILGMDESKKNLIQIYAIMGRSENSRNRVFVCADGNRLETKAADPAKVTDPNLIIYEAMNSIGNIYVVSNGHQTTPALLHRSENASLKGLMNLDDWKYEPDEPNYTPRITGMIVNSLFPHAEILILKKSPFGTDCQKQLYHYTTFQPGYGYCVSTYEGDGNPLPPFEGEPYLLPLSGGHHEIAGKLWKALNPDNRVSLAVKAIDIQTGKITMEIINKYHAVD